MDVAEARGGAKGTGGTEPGCQKLTPAAWTILSPRLVTGETGTLREHGGCTLCPPRAQGRPPWTPAVGPWAPLARLRSKVAVGQVSPETGPGPGWGHGGCGWDARVLGAEGPDGLVPWAGEGAGVPGRVP